MGEYSEGIPVTFGMLLEALNRCGLAVGFALAGTLNTAGTDCRVILAVAFRCAQARPQVGRRASSRRAFSTTG